MIKTEYTSNLTKFLTWLNVVETAAITDMAAVGVKKIKEETPVRTGNLRDSNYADIQNKNIDFLNEADYAAYVEFGTFLQSSNPFMRRGIQIAKKEFLNILIRRLKIWIS